MSLHVDAVSQFERGDLEGARQTVERFLQHEAVDHVQFGDGLLLLSSIQCAAKEYDEAERMVATCHGYLQEHLGPSHHGVATALLNRAVILLERFTLESSLLSVLPTAERGPRDDDEPSLVPKERRSPLRGPSHPKRHSDLSASTSSNPIILSGNTNAPASSAPRIERVVDAQKYLAEAERLVENTFGPDRLVLADIHHNHGVCCEILGGYTDALEHYLKSLKIREKFKDTSGATDLKLALTMEHVAMIYRLTEVKLGDAVRLLAVVAQTRRKYLGPSHPLYAAALFEQGVCALESLHRRLAIPLFLKCLEIRVKVLGVDHLETKLVLHYLKGIEHEHLVRLQQQSAASFSSFHHNGHQQISINNVGSLGLQIERILHQGRRMLYGGGSVLGSSEQYRSKPTVGTPAMTSAPTSPMLERYRKMEEHSIQPHVRGSQPLPSRGSHPAESPNESVVLDIKAEDNSVRSREGNVPPLHPNNRFR